MRNSKLILGAFILAAGLAPAVASAACNGRYEFGGTDVVIGKVTRVSNEKSADGFVRGNAEIAAIEVTQVLRGRPDGKMFIRTIPRAGDVPVLPGRVEAYLSFQEGQEIGLVLPHSDRAVSDIYDFTYERCDAGPVDPAALPGLLQETKRKDTGRIALFALLLVPCIGLVVFSAATKKLRTRGKVAAIVGSTALTAWTALAVANAVLRWYGNTYL